MSFADDGYVVTPLFQREEILGLQRAVAGHMERISRALHLPLAESAPDAPFDQRIESLAASDPSYAHLLGAAVATDAFRDPVAQAIANDQRLTAAAESLLGMKVTGRTVRFRGNSSAMSQHRQHWHSDVARLDDTPCSTVRLTAWIPLVDAGPDTGGLELATGRRAAPLPHDSTPGKFHIDEAALTDTPRASPRVPMGSVLLMDRFIPHRALPNISGRTRWSLVVWLKAAA